MQNSRPYLWGLLGLTILLFLPICLSGDFIWDDPKLVLLNQWTSDWSQVGAMFTHDIWESTPLGAGEFFYYRPMMLVSLTIDQSLGFGPVGHHLHSLGWHLLCVVLLFHLCRDSVESTWALIGGLSLFALHPLQTESIAHIAARNDLMACAGILGALNLLKKTDPETPALLGAACLSALAIFSKETGFLAPAMLWAMDRARFGHALNPKRYGALLLPIGLALGLRLSLGGSGLPTLELETALPKILDSIGFYLGALVFPLNHTPVVSASEMSLFWPASLLGLMGLVALYRHSSPFGQAGLQVALLAFLPAVLGLGLTENTAFRYLYFPLAGLSMALCVVLSRAPRWANAGILLGLYAVSSTQLSQWQSDRSLWTHAYNSAPGLQSSCGLFKSIEAEALKTPQGPAREALFQEAEPWLGRALEAPTNPYCCLSASRWMWDRNQQEWGLQRPQKAVEWGLTALENGCEKTAELLVPLATSEALLGHWDRAEERLINLQRDPFGLRAIVLSAAALRKPEPDRSVLEAFAGPNPDAQVALAGKVQFFLDASLENQRPTAE